MRKKFVAGNWKMNMDAASAKALATGLKDELAKSQASGKVDVAVCPPFVYLPIVAEALAGSSIGLGAQDVYIEGNGAFTGEISTDMLKDVGCQYVIIGHSERRHVIGETNELINKKVLVTLQADLEPIFCIGELLEEREGNKTEAVLEMQIRKGLENVTAEQMAKVTIAYEPVWAIGTGKVASDQQAQDAHVFTRSIIKDMFGDDVAAAVRIQYGGSVKPGNAKGLMGQSDVDGALVGGAALKVEDFIGIIDGTASCDSGGCGCNCKC